MPNSDDDTTQEPATPIGESRAGTREEESEGEDCPDTFEDIWARLTDVQQEYVLARQQYRYKNEAAEACNVHQSTVYSWPDYVDEAVQKFRDHRKDAMKEGLQDAATRAVQRLKGILDEEEEDLRAVMKAIRLSIEQEVGKATQKQEIQHSGGIDLGEDDEEELDNLVANLNAEEEEGE